MNLTGKQRAYLRSLAAKEDTILQLGKDGVSDSFVKSVETAVAARELVKFRVLESAMISPGTRRRRWQSKSARRLLRLSAARRLFTAARTIIC